MKLDRHGETADQIAPRLQKLELHVVRRCEFGKANADAHQTHAFASARECLDQKRAVIFERRRKPGALHGRAREISKLQFHENFRDLSARLFLRELRHQFVKQFLQPFSRIRRACSRSLEERFLVAERFALAIRLDRALIDPAA